MMFYFKLQLAVYKFHRIRRNLAKCAFIVKSPFDQRINEPITQGVYPRMLLIVCEWASALTIPGCDDLRNISSLLIYNYNE